KRFVKPPSEVASPFVLADRPRLFRPTGDRLLRCVVPLALPTVESDSSDRVYVGSAANPMMSEHARPEEDSHWLLPIEACVSGEPLKHLMQLGGEFPCD